MFFTREPIVESVITPREGCKLVIRNSKVAGQEEYFVDAVEVVNFGTGCFFRSLERPKSFLVPCSDYEVLEVRETRMVLKHVASAEKATKPASREREKAPQEEQPASKQASARKEPPAERKKERRKRRRKGREERETEEEGAVDVIAEEEALSDLQEEVPPPSPPPTMRVIPPPKTLISESIGRYKEMLARAETDEEVEDQGLESIPEDEDQLGDEVPFSPSHLVRHYPESDEEDAVEDRIEED